VQRLRHQADAVLTGVGTVLADDPLLTDRTGRPRRRRLLRVVLDAGLRLPLDSRLARSVEDRDVVIFCGEDVWLGKRAKLIERGVEVIELKEAGGRISLHAVLQHLAEREVTSVLLEAGSQVNSSALEANLADKAWLFYAPTFLGGEALSLLAAPGTLPPLRSYRLHRFGPDFALEGYWRDVYRDH
jgi:diaminohydroxyphosphoribosylaminopyrimidine deaminase/5-amino-6-(5-phosphoribosylamino)uracil reductase